MPSTDRLAPRPRASTRAPVYVYGVTWRRAPLPGGEGIGGRPVVAVEHGDLVALATELPSPHVRAAWRDLLRHAEVLREVFAHEPVLPLRFGTVFATAADVVDDLLSGRRDELERLLDAFADAAELSVRARYHEEAVLAEIVRDDSRVASLRARGRGTRGDDVALGEAVAKALSARRARDADAIVGRLTPLARDVAVDDPRTEYEVLRAAFLVERRRIDEFDAEMAELARAREATTVFKYVGPLPPHTFVRLGGS